MLVTSGSRAVYGAPVRDPAAVVAFVVGGVLAVGGSHSAPRTGLFPEDGPVPFPKPFAGYGWAVGLVASPLVHVLLMRRAGAAR